PMPTLMEDWLMLKILLLLAATTALAQTAYQSLARDVLKELIEINTTDTTGDNTPAAEAIHTRFCNAATPYKWKCSSPLPRHRLCETGPLYRAPGRRRSPAQRLECRPFQTHRRGRILLRTRHPGHQEQRRHDGGRIPAHEAGELPSLARPGPGSNRRRRGWSGKRRQMARHAASRPRTPPVLYP